MIKKIAILSIIILFTLLFIYCTTDDNTITGPFGNADKYISVSDFSADKSLLYSNGDTTIVRIRVLDVDKTPAIGLIVDFSAKFGIITESDITDSSGIATATFISDNNTGENIITADTGVKKHTLTLRIIHYQPKYIELFSDSPVLLADGNSTIQITAVFKDSVGNPMPDLLVTFSTTLGVLYPTITKTDGNGMATTDLRSTDSEGVATVSATSGVTKSIEISFKKYLPAFIEISSEFSRIFADGNSTTTITAVVKDSTGKQMEGETVRFATTNGTLSETIKLTNQDGIASAELTSSTTPGIVIITASSFVSDSIEVEFARYIPSTIEMSASLESILADGLSTSTITAVPKDINGQPLPGIAMVFSTALGKLSDTIKTTDTEGSAKTTYTSSGSILDATASITAAVIYTDTSISKDINIQLRGITSITKFDSTKMSDSGIYKAYIRTNLFETSGGDNIGSGVVSFSSPIGTMD
ncbi:MAG: Ig-like domain-containing protein, partial [Candidatus Marinimicrobia bacterium]|nr:Ig-like domain-containing protein [Candidatus Neomarinimicrobiota bacterium]